MAVKIDICFAQKAPSTLGLAGGLSERCAFGRAKRVKGRGAKGRDAVPMAWGIVDEDR